MVSKTVTRSTLELVITERFVVSKVATNGIPEVTMTAV